MTRHAVALQCGVGFSHPNLIPISRTFPHCEGRLPSQWTRTTEMVSNSLTHQLTASEADGTDETAPPAKRDCTNSTANSRQQTYCGGALRQPRFLAFWGLFCLFGPFRQKRRLFGSAATKTLVWPPSAMVLGVFESARRPKCNVIAGLRHVRRLESARTPQKEAPPSARGAISKRLVFNARSAILGVWVCFSGPWEYTHRSLF